MDVKEMRKKRERFVVVQTYVEKCVLEELERQKISASVVMRAALHDIYAQIEGETKKSKIMNGTKKKMFSRKRVKRVVSERSNKKWTNEELEQLRKFYEDAQNRHKNGKLIYKKVRDFAKKMGRTDKAIFVKMYALDPTNGLRGEK